MVRAFQSRDTSADKKFVSEVFSQLSAARAHYDTETFDDRKRTAEEIEIAFKDTGLFVLFASERALGSEWVKSEIASAQHFYTAGRVKRIAVVLLDGIPREALPEWLQQFIINRAAASRFVAEKIKSVLFEIDVDSAPIRICIGREDDLHRLKAGFLASASEIPNAVCLAGSRGIGRRTLLRKFLEDLFPRIAASVVTLVLPNEGSESDFYRLLVDLERSRTVEELADASERFTPLGEAERTAILIRMIQGHAAGGLIVLQGEESLVTDSGDFQPWLSRLLSELPDATRPLLAIITKRFVGPQQRDLLSRTAFHHVRSLSTTSSRDLLTFSLRQLTQKPVPPELSAIAEMVDGHPGQILLTARLVAQGGPHAAALQTRDLKSVLAGRASELAGMPTLSTAEELVIALLDEFGLLTAGAIEGTAEDSVAMLRALAKLHSLGIVEEVGPYFRIAPYLVEAFRDVRRRPHVNSFLRDVRRSMVEELKDVSPGERVPIEYLDSRIAAAIRDRGVFDNPLIARAILPSQLLRVARRVYDERSFELAAELCGRALDRRIALSGDGTVEALRIKALSHARLGQITEFEKVIESLRTEYEGDRSRKSSFARRIEAFLCGFKCRLEGDIDAAAGHYRRAFTHSGQKNVHVLRELAQCLFLQGKVTEALEFAEAAYEQAKDPPNPFVIDILLEIMIKLGASEERLGKLMSELERADETWGTTFWLLRKADIAKSQKDYSKALNLVDRVIANSPHLLKAYLLRADIKGMLGQFDAQARDLKTAKEAASRELGPKDYRLAPRIAAAEISMHASRGDFDNAIRMLKFAKLPAAVRQELSEVLQSKMAKFPEKVSALAKIWSDASK